MVPLDKAPIRCLLMALQHFSLRVRIAGVSERDRVLLKKPFIKTKIQLHIDRPRLAHLRARVEQRDEQFCLYID